MKEKAKEGVLPLSKDLHLEPEGQSSSRHPPSNQVNEFTFLGGDRTPMPESSCSISVSEYPKQDVGYVSSTEQYLNEKDIFSSWASETNVPISASAIQELVLELQNIFKFQESSARNIYELFMSLLDSRALRMAPDMALRSLHGDYIGGPKANYRKWYFATEMDSEDSVRVFHSGQHSLSESKKDRLLRCAEEQWVHKMARLSAGEYAVQILLYLLIWGECNNLRFMPECICFIYQCCLDHYEGHKYQRKEVENSFLDHIVTPIYSVLRKQSYTLIDGKLTHVDKDHSCIIGYDDINQLFWHRKGIMKIKVANELSIEPILMIERPNRYLALGYVLWERVFLKTYRESRTWLHIIVNFNRVLNIHLALFWVFTSFHSYPLYTANYDVNFDNAPPIQVHLSIMSLAGALLTLTSLIACLLEMWFCPRRWPGSYPVIWRLCALVLVFALNVAPTGLIFGHSFTGYGDKIGIVFAGIHVAIGILTCLYLILVPPTNLFGCNLKGRSHLAAKYFTSDFHALSSNGKATSVCLWIVVFACKFTESFFFLAIPLRAPIRELSTMQTQCLGDQLLGSFLCLLQPMVCLLLIYFLEFALFLLDTYLWYVIWSTSFSVFKLMRMGNTIWSPWRSIYDRLPRRIYSKLLVQPKCPSGRRSRMVAQIWNLIVIAMYRDHLLSIEQVQRLMFDISTGGQDCEPAFFGSQEDGSHSLSFFSGSKEAERRIAFFAQSLTHPISEAREIKTMASFSVLIPHYSERIILLLKEIVQQEDKQAHGTLLEYLKLLHPAEWKNFVRDTMIMAQEDSETGIGEKEDHVFLTVGFKDTSPTYVMRTRIWALLRTQTLYRTVSGFMNYLRAIKIFYDLESGDVKESITAEDRLKLIHKQTCRKFKIIVAMQQFKNFTTEELECVDILLYAYPEVQIAYIDEVLDEEKGGVAYFLCLIDGSCPKSESRGREPRFRIRLSGYPILGDGKADNQNHALIFIRGEYLQLVDANQDNYIEECLKIRNVLGEFEHQNQQDPYDKSSVITNPVAIVGTREYIFSENTGILGDIAAGKEQTFGALFARTLAQIGGKLHYGHPDFLNSVFMTTRGGVSKAQKGLHLNEDIYAGMTALTRGGRIKHCEYMQCGKGRDLGFTSILNFITKIGAGMGEQILSREYFYLGTHLPLDRLLSFYYAHLGFHLNNYFIVFSIQLFLLTGINVAALTKESILCDYDPLQPFAFPRVPSNCRNLIPVVLWLEKTVKSIFFVFILSLLPLALHELAERGLKKALTRTSKQILSLLPFFEVFVCRIYSHALTSDLTVGGAQYISTGRGFASKRESIADLYSRFGHELLSFGIFMLSLVLYLSVSIWLYAYIFFWMTILGFVMAPFIFNPGQYSIQIFILDYSHMLHWLYLGNRKQTLKTWIEYTKIERSRLTGIKLKMKYGTERVKYTNFVRPSRLNVVVTILFPNLCTAAIIGCAYLFANSQNEILRGSPSHALMRIIFITSVPIVLNATSMLLVFVFNVLIGWLLSRIFEIYPAIIAFVARSMSLVFHLVSFLILWQLQNYNFAQTILGFTLSSVLQKIVLQTLTVLILSREVMDQRPNRAWWSGRWIKAGLGWRVVTQPIREFICKVSEQSQFACDFIICHIITFLQIPLLFVPFIDTWHLVMLMWVKPTSHLRRLSPRPEFSKREVAWAASVFIVLVLIFAAFVAAVAIIPRLKWLNLEVLIPQILKPLIQPLLSAEEFPKGIKAVSLTSS